MKLNLSTDYALRVLIFLGSKPDELHSIETLSRTYDLPQSSLMKVVSELVRHGYVSSTRGRAGGIRLGKDPSEINIGDVVRAMDENLDIIDCTNCILDQRCRLKGVLSEATAAFLKVLCSYSLADLISTQDDFLALFALPERPQNARRM